LIYKLSIDSGYFKQVIPGVNVNSQIKYLTFIEVKISSALS